MPRVLIADELSPTALSIFRDRGVDLDVRTGLDPAELLAVAGRYDGIAVRSATRVTAEVLAAADNLKVVGRAGVGVDNVDVAAATARGVIVMNTPSASSVTTAEHAIALLFALARQIPGADRSTQAGRWEKHRFIGVELTAKTLGVIGCGHIGSVVADRARGLRMKVIACDPYLAPERALERGVELVALDELLARADFITLHTPLTERTKNLLNRETLARTRPGVRIVNCARGGLVDEAALREALDAGHVAGAALDVFSREPARDNPLFGHPHVVCTPHLGAATSEAQENVAREIADQMADYLLHGAIANAVNFPSIGPEEAPRLRPFIALAEKLGSLVAQLTDTRVTALTIAFEGQVAAMNRPALTAAALAGVLRPVLQSVNVVSAPVVARERGIRLAETTRAAGGDHESLISLIAEAGRRHVTVAGTVYADGRPRIVDIDGIRMDAGFAPSMIYVANVDKPGFVGAFGAALGDADINIATFHVGREAPGGHAIALVEIDGELPPEVLARVQSLPRVRHARPLKF
jgi:D-3-phosphoglycerate dehydrogenase